MTGTGLPAEVNGVNRGPGEDLVKTTLDSFDRPIISSNSLLDGAPSDLRHPLDLLYGQPQESHDYGRCKASFESKLKILSDHISSVEKLLSTLNPLQEIPPCPRVVENIFKVQAALEELAQKQSIFLIHPALPESLKNYLDSKSLEQQINFFERDLNLREINISSQASNIVEVSKFLNGEDLNAPDLLQIRNALETRLNVFENQLSWISKRAAAGVQVPELNLSDKAVGNILKLQKVLDSALDANRIQKVLIPELLSAYFDKHKDARSLAVATLPPATEAEKSEQALKQEAPLKTETTNAKPLPPAARNDSSGIVGKFINMIMNSSRITQGLVMSGIVGFSTLASYAFMSSVLSVPSSSAAYLFLSSVSTLALPVAIGLGAGWLCSSLALKMCTAWVKNDLKSPWAAFNISKAYADPAELRNMCTDAVMVVGKLLDQDKQATRASELINHYFGDDLLRGNHSEESQNNILARSMPELEELLRVVSKSLDGKNLEERMTFGDKIFGFFFSRRMVATKELSRYLGETINMAIDVCRQSIQRSNKDRQQYAGAVQSIVSQTLSSLINKAQVDFCEKAVESHLEALHISKLICKYGVIGTGIAGLFGLLPSVTGAATSTSGSGLLNVLK
jgi:hypothetical protein